MTRCGKADVLITLNSELLALKREEVRFWSQAKRGGGGGGIVAFPAKDL